MGHKTKEIEFYGMTEREMIRHYSLKVCMYGRNKVVETLMICANHLFSHNTPLEGTIIINQAIFVLNYYEENEVDRYHRYHNHKKNQ